MSRAVSQESDRSMSWTCLDPCCKLQLFVTGIFIHLVNKHGY